MSKDHVSDAMIEEYKSLRAESLNAILHRNQITGLSFTALSLMISAASIAKLTNEIASAVLVVLVPSIAKLVCFSWLGEYERSKRAGAAIEAIEHKINEYLGENALTWEHDLSKKGISMVYPYVAALGIMLGSGYVSLFLSSIFLLKYFTEDRPVSHPYEICATILLFAITVELIYLGQLRKMWRSARSRYSSMFRADEKERSTTTKDRMQDAGGAI